MYTRQQEKTGKVIFQDLTPAGMTPAGTPAGNDAFQAAKVRKATPEPCYLTFSLL
jgi:hypothetical protein